MRSNNLSLEYTFGKNRTLPISSYVTERETTQSTFDSYQYPNKSHNSQNSHHPQFLSLINHHPKRKQEQNLLQSSSIAKYNRESPSFFHKLCRCVQIEKDVIKQNKKIAEPPRVDLRHLVIKNKQTQVMNSQKRSLTPINSLVSLLDQRR